MSAVPPIVIALTTLYSAACSYFGPKPGSPLWLRWPIPVWNRIAHDWRRPRLRPDHAKIARLERELGIRDTDKEPTA